MKRNIILSAITSAALLLLTAACSNDDNTEPQQEPTQEVRFSFTNEDFGEDEILTRAANSEEAKPQIVDLGDCEAEITIENEPAAKKTRGAQTPANGHYTIRAYQGGTLKGEIKGTFNGGKFSPDASSKRGIILPHGTYDFVAFNDDVTASGNDLTVARYKARTAMMGTTTTVINRNPKQQVYFVMKHVGARLRTQFVCQKHIPNGITTTLEGAAANVIPMSVAYDPETKAYTATNGTMFRESNNSPASTETKYTDSNYGQSYAYTSTSTNYHYFLPTTEASNLKLSFSAGTIFWNPITAAQKLNMNLSMQSGKSYLVKLKLKPQYTYLMSDGTTGYFKDTAFGGAPAATAKTPIALVLDKENGIGIALKDAGNRQFMQDSYQTNPSPKYNTYTAPTISAALTGPTPSGYNETWDASCSTAEVPGNKVKGENPGFYCFWDAAHYDPGVPYTGTPAAKWFLPSATDWKLLYFIGFGDRYASLNKRDVQYPWYANLLRSAFTQVGGTAFDTRNVYKTSTETRADNDDQPTSEYGNVVAVLGDRIWWAGWADNRGSNVAHGPTRAFVKFKF